MCIDFKQVATAVLVGEAHRELLCEGLAERSLAGAWGSMQEHYAVDADQRGFDSAVGEEQRGRRVFEQRLDL